MGWMGAAGRMGAAEPTAPCPPPCCRGGEDRRYRPPACARATGPPAQIWRLLAGVPGEAPYLHVRVHACVPATVTTVR